MSKGAYKCYSHTESGDLLCRFWLAELTLASKLEQVHNLKASQKLYVRELVAKLTQVLHQWQLCPEVDLHACFF